MSRYLRPLLSFATGFLLAGCGGGDTTGPSSSPASKLAFTVQPGTVTAGAAISPAVQVTVQDAQGNTVTSSTASITLAISSGTGTGTSGAVLGGTLTGAAVSGVATFNDLTIDKAGTGYTLTATATSLTSATSTSFTVRITLGTLGFNYATQSLGIGQYMRGCGFDEFCPITNVSLPAGVANPVMVTLTHSDASKVTTPASVTIPAGMQAVNVSVVGAAVGVDTIIASTSGYAPDTLIVTVGLGSVEFYNWACARPMSCSLESSVRVGETVSSGYLILVGPGGGGREQVRVAATTTFTLTPPPNFVFVDGSGNTITSVTFAAGAYTSSALSLKGVAPGTGAATASAPNYTTTTSPSTTVTN